MPWKECEPMDERLRFVARLLDGEKMAPLCREFGISRVTGYKLFNRYRECGRACQKFCVRGGFHARELVNRSPYKTAN
jgi:transposase